jgi:hypothetical protein
MSNVNELQFLADMIADCITLSLILMFAGFLHEFAEEYIKERQEAFRKINNREL